MTRFAFTCFLFFLLLLLLHFNHGCLCECFPKFSLIGFVREHLVEVGILLHKGSVAVIDVREGECLSRPAHCVELWEAELL